MTSVMDDELMNFHSDNWITDGKTTVKEPPPPPYNQSNCLQLQRLRQSVSLADDSGAP